MAINVKLEKFEGPLDLLLFLVNRHKLDIYDIEISLLLEQYLEYIDGLEQDDFDQAGDFLAMAARLVYIKTCSLLPKAEEAEELAAAEEISPEDAAAAMDAAVAAHPDMEAELLDEANGEAIADLAGAEQEVGELADGAQMLADGASQVLNEEVTPDMIADALGDVEQMADEMGVDPMDLIVAAAQEIQQGEDPNDEDMANAKEMVDMAAEQGITPEELIQQVAAAIDADEMGGEEAAAAEEPIEKAASLQKQPVNRRVAYVAEQLRNAKA